MSRLLLFYQVECPYCRGDGCDPNDTGTAIVADCPACSGACRVTESLAALIRTGMANKWSWNKFYQMKQLEGR